MPTVTLEATLTAKRFRAWIDQKEIKFKKKGDTRTAEVDLAPGDHEAACFVVGDAGGSVVIVSSGTSAPLNLIAKIPAGEVAALAIGGFRV